MNKPTARAPLRWVGTVGLCLAGAPLLAAEPDLAACKGLAVDADRLSCYDRQVGRAAMVALPAPIPVAPAAQPVPTAPAEHSLLSSYWELDSADKRGTFNFTGYQPNYFLPLQTSTRVNQAPSSPTRGTTTGLPQYKHVEAKLQLSLRTKVAQNLLLSNADLWVAYTQQSLWQTWNQRASAPFRVTDHQPELIYAMPTPRFLQMPAMGWSWRLVQLGVLHESNGQSGTLSRSWSHLYALAGFERDEVTASWRFEQRLDGTDANSKDDNPDIVHYLGRSRLQIGWIPGLSTVYMTWRPSLSGKGSVQLDWTFPLDRSKPDGVRAYVQLFHGYGQTILDYNFRQSTLGLGLTLMKF
jgi:phospholipase A1